MHFACGLMCILVFQKADWGSQNDGALKMLTSKSPGPVNISLPDKGEFTFQMNLKLLIS